MKSFIKKFKLYFIFLLAIFIVLAIYVFFYNKQLKKDYYYSTFVPTLCLSVNSNDFSKLPSVDDKFLEEQIEMYSPYCHKKIGYNWWMHYNNLDQAFHNSLHILPLLVLILTAIYYNSHIKTKFFTYETMRQNYKKVIRKHIFSMYFISTIIPLTAIYLIILLSIISGNLSNKELVSLYGEYIYIPTLFQNKMLLFYILYIINLVLYGIILSNILIIVFKKAKNVIVAILSSYVFYNVFNILCYITLSLILVYGILPYTNYSGDVGVLWNYFDMETVWIPNIVNNPLLFSIFMIVLTIISTIIVKKEYSDEESVVMCNEI